MIRFDMSIKLNTHMRMWLLCV